jgi:site-specific DNA-methyltransferase (adenine-specific)
MGATMSIVQIVNGDCLTVLKALPDACFDSVVTDPPAGIGFMGKAWDGNKGGRNQWVAWLSEVMGECLRVLKPGGHALVWALPRTSHWTATAVEDAGFEIRDVVMHIFGSGFPKSLDVSKALDKAAGAKREVIGVKPSNRPNVIGKHSDKMDGGAYTERLETAPATEAAKQWEGWGTALKPAAEHWILARKPFKGTVAANVQEYGTGAINIDGCRISVTESLVRPSIIREDNTTYGHGLGAGTQTEPLGRWPANVTLDEEAAEALDAQSGTSKSRASGYDFADSGNDNPTRIAHNIKSGIHFADTGGASRFFYVAKPSTKERNAGLETNAHPTVKPIALMRYLCRLITPPGGIILDPFCGSGTTGCAAVLEGFGFVGIEMDAEHVATAEARIAHWAATVQEEAA